MIQVLAYDIYKSEGCPDGRALQHWLDAEKLVNEQLAPVAPLVEELTSLDSAVEPKLRRLKRSLIEAG